jgi:hypothetical protein
VNKQRNRESMAESEEVSLGRDFVWHEIIYN